MDGVLCKLRHAIPWYDLPYFYLKETPSEGHLERPSWQTCYRAYRHWRRQGIMERVYRLLFQDLRDRGGTEILQLFKDGVISLDSSPTGKTEILLSKGQDTWQGSTIQLLFNVILLRRKKARRTTLAP